MHCFLVFSHLCVCAVHDCFKRTLLKSQAEYAVSEGSVVRALPAFFGSPSPSRPCTVVCASEYLGSSSALFRFAETVLYQPANAAWGSVGSIGSTLGQMSLATGVSVWARSQPMLCAQGVPLAGTHWVGLLAWFLPTCGCTMTSAAAWFPGQFCSLGLGHLLSNGQGHGSAFLTRWVGKPGSLTIELDVWASQPGRLFTRWTEPLAGCSAPAP